MGRFTGRAAIVTGASRGIGAALAERLAAEGADVLVAARTVDQHDHLSGSLNETVERCRRYGTTVVALGADLSDPESRAQIVPTALERFGRVDVLVNNAAAAIYAPLIDYPLRRRLLTFEVNVHAPVDLAQAALPSMLERGEGWILNVSSGTAFYERGHMKNRQMMGPKIGVYGASKAALNRITQEFARELVDTGVRMNTVSPRIAVLSEGADALVGGILAADQVESMEAMVEGALVLCDCPEDWTGGIHISLDLLDELDTTVMELDASGPYPGGQHPSQD